MKRHPKGTYMSWASNLTPGSVHIFSSIVKKSRKTWAVSHILSELLLNTS